MSLTYATIADLRDWTGQDSATLTDSEATRALTLSERDIDGLSPVLHPINTTSGRRYSPASLSALQAIVLQRATCAQAEYILSMGEDFFIRGQYDSVNGPDFSTSGRLPRIAPAVWRELAGSGLVRLSTTTGRRYFNPKVDEDFDQKATVRDEFERG